MELRRFRYFVAVVEEGGFTRAAERLHVAQPGISAQIRLLERELGAELLDRTGRGVRLTAAGEAVLPYARAALAAVDGARDAVAELAGLVRGRVSIGMVTSMPSDIVPDLLAGYHRDHPNVEIRLVEGNSHGLLRELLAGALDVVFVGLAGEPPAGVGVQTVRDEEFVAVVGPNDPLASAGTVPLHALGDRALAVLPTGTGVRDAVERAFAAAGLTPRVAFEAADPYVVAQLAARGLGVALVPRSLADAHSDEWRRVLIEGGVLRGRLVLAWRSDGPVSPAARVLTTRARARL
ncbi:HTH-type transcriptional regulator GltC [Actinomadura rubteroloni]|uniref:HTH-type transcriptional regulator GltC n=1 Tax=Actinomadura rubteroloni TaxID=1926885 RepID=A0A2P4UMR9_9ACTN|nr:LysR substrate-binding domain-containing protein [Actinomadura rubteroloni]POM26344.1 HTH-type transcriptional regulator GltC [Actinomadura rubteroloni]